MRAQTNNTSTKTHTHSHTLMDAKINEQLRITTKSMVGYIGSQNDHCHKVAINDKLLFFSLHRLTTSIESFLEIIFLNL